jgi:hypothetical protein
MNLAGAAVNDRRVHLLLYAFTAAKVAYFEITFLLQVGPFS